MDCSLSTTCVNWFTNVTLLKVVSYTLSFLSLLLFKFLHYEMMHLDLEKKQAKKRELSGGYECKGSVKHPSKPVYEGLEAGRTLESIGKKAGCSHQTAFQYKKIKEAGREKEILEKSKSINAVFKELRKEGKTQYADIEFPSKNYRVVYADLYEY